MQGKGKFVLGAAIGLGLGYAVVLLVSPTRPAADRRAGIRLVKPAAERRKDLTAV